MSGAVVKFPREKAGERSRGGKTCLTREDILRQKEMLVFKKEQKQTV